MHQKFDEGQFRELIVESQDLQSDAMTGARRDLSDYVGAAREANYERRNDERSRPRPGVGTAVLAAGGLGLASLAFAGSASAATIDVQALQTAASLENLAVFTYKTALGLPFIGGSSANGVVKAFATMTMKQHKEHGEAFNAAAKKLGGKEQTKTNPKYTPIVMAAAGKIKNALDVVSLAITLEDAATETYVKNIGQVTTADLRTLFGSVAGVEAQHKATLLAVQALLMGGLASEIKLPPDAAKLPAAAGSVGFPDSFFPTSKASPVTEGAVS